MEDLGPADEVDVDVADPLVRPVPIEHDPEAEPYCSSGFVDDAIRLRGSQCDQVRPVRDGPPGRA